jgi:hypothetical protein
MGEQEYYPLVRKWLESKGYYCGGFIEDSEGNPFYFQDKGTARTRVDVAGIKDIGASREYEIEVVAVEVRDAARIKYRDLQDALTHSQYAHKCYLATTGEIVDLDKEDAHRLGVGLLRISGDRITEILSSGLNNPNQAKLLHFLGALEIARCVLCGCYFETLEVKEEKYKTFYRIRRPKYFKIAHEHPKANALNPSELRKLPRKYKTYGYLCRLCKEEFFS